MKIYTIFFICVLIFLFIKTLNETFQQNFGLPKVKLQRVKKEIEKAEKKNKFKYNVDETIKSGSGVHDRIRYQGKWN